MKTKIKTLALVVSLLLLLLHARSDASVDTAWKFNRNKDGIEVQLRYLPELNLKEFKGVMYVKGVRLSSMVATFDDTSSYTRWMHNCTESRLLKYINVQERITYTVTHAPWPAKDRDVVVYSLMTQNPEDLSVTIAIDSKPEFIPQQKDRVRIPRMKASWTFKPLDSGTVMIVYQTYTDPGGPLPLWLLNLSVSDLPFFTMQKFRAAVKEQRYAAATYSVIEEPLVN